MRLVHLGDRVGQLAPSPIFKPVDTAALPGDHGAIPLDHPGHLLALVRVNNKDDFVVMHADSLLMDVSQWTLIGRAHCCSGASPTASSVCEGEAREPVIIR